MCVRTCKLEPRGIDGQCNARCGRSSCWQGSDLVNRVTVSLKLLIRCVLCMLLLEDILRHPSVPATLLVLRRDRSRQTWGDSMEQWLWRGFANWRLGW